MTVVTEARVAGARPGVPRESGAAHPIDPARHWPCSRLRTVDHIRTQVGLRSGAGPPRRPLQTVPYVRRSARESHFVCAHGYTATERRDQPADESAGIRAKDVPEG